MCNQYFATISIAAAVLVVGAPRASSQELVRLPLSAPLSTVIEGCSFSDGVGASFFSADAILTWPNFRGQNPGNATSIGLSGTSSPSTTWMKLNESTAAYLAVGADGLEATSDDQLILVSGLPSAPVLRPTNVLGLQWPLVAVNDTTAVGVRPSGFVVVRFDSATGSASQSFVPTGTSIELSSASGVYALDEQAVVAVDRGLDGVFGTGDEDLVILAGLQGNNWFILRRSLPVGPPVRGFAVTPSGVGVLMLDSPLPQVDLYIVEGLNTTPVFAPFSVQSPVLGLPLFAEVKPGPWDSILVSCFDDFGPGAGRTLVSRLSSVPSSDMNWYDDFNCGCTSAVLSDHEVARYSAVVTNAFDIYETTLGQSLRVAQSWTSGLGFSVPNRDALIAVGDGASNGAFPRMTVGVHRALWSSPAFYSQDLADAWVGGGKGVSGQGVEPGLWTLSEGLAAAFVNGNGLASGPITHLLLISAPSVASLEEGSLLGMSPVELGADLPPFGSPSRVLTVALRVPTTWPTAAGAIGVALDREQQPQFLPAPFFPSDSLFWLKPESVFGVASVIVSLGRAEYYADLNQVVPQLIGRPLYLQALANDGVALHSSNLLLLVVR